MELCWIVAENPYDATNAKEFDTENDAIEYAKTQVEHATLGVWDNHYNHLELRHIICIDGVFTNNDE